MPNARLVVLVALTVAVLALTAACPPAADTDTEVEPPTQEELAPDEGSAESAEQTEPETPDLPTEDETEPAVRGDYLVNVILRCGRCHGEEDGMHLAGRTCAEDDERCQTVPNLTPHATGLAEYGDEEIRAMTFEGRRPDGTGIGGMPTSAYANLNANDQAAIVAYLRSIPAVENSVPPREYADGAPNPEPAQDISHLPSPAPDSPNYESAMRGRYLVVNTGACVGCHTPDADTEEHQPDLNRFLAGGHPFSPGRMGMEVPPWPEEIFSSNLTPHASGIAGWSADDVAASLIEGVEPDGGRVCPPMPSGPHGSLANLTREDGVDIGNYLLSLPPIENEVPECDPPPPAE